MRRTAGRSSPAAQDSVTQLGILASAGQAQHDGSAIPPNLWLAQHLSMPAGQQKKSNTRTRPKRSLNSSWLTAWVDHTVAVDVHAAHQPCQLFIQHLLAATCIMSGTTSPHSWVVPQQVNTSQTACYGPWHANTLSGLQVPSYART